MRYINVATISFTNIDGTTRPAKDLREIPSDRVKSIISRLANEDMDLIATRHDVFGEGREADTFRLLDANAVQVVESGFDYSEIAKIKVPVIE